MAEESAESLIDTGATDAKVRPDHIPEKFWNAETGGVRIKELAGAYTGAESLIGKRLQELGDDDRGKLFEHARGYFTEPLTKELREKLAADDEFLAPIREKWAADNKPVVPEAYEVPEALREFAPVDDPLTVGMSEWAKDAGLSQDQFNGMVGKFASVIEGLKTASTAKLDEIKASIGPDYAKREKVVVTALRGAGEWDPDVLALTKSARTDAEFRGLEKIVARFHERPLPSSERGPVTVNVDTEIANLRNKYRNDPAADKDAINRELQSLYAQKYGQEAARA